MILKQFYLLIVISFVAIVAEEVVEISTQLGDIQGTVRKSANGRDYIAFQGIPFAKPPIGKHRFSEPIPFGPWIGTWIANQTYRCYQFNFQNEVNGEDDCLYLDVFVPKEHLHSQAKLDVITYIHGGGFQFGSNQDFSPPQNLMDRDVILTSINYRLGPFGFLSTEDKQVPGNNGLKDQALALKWIKENIASFGGNPDSISLIGHSAGGASVHYHYFSPLSRGLFHKGISHSGTALAFCAYQEYPLKNALKLGEMLKCPNTEDTKTLMACIKQRSSKDILQASLGLYYANALGLLFVPTVEKVVTARTFLAEHPYKILKEGRTHNVPWMTSTTLHDGTVAIYQNPSESYEDEWVKLMDNYFGIGTTAPNVQEAASKIRQHYFGNNKIDLDNLIRSSTDRFFLIEAIKSAKLQSQNSAPVYYYVFSYDGSRHFTDLFVAKDPQRYANFVGHMDDAIYLFPYIPDSYVTDDDKKMKEIFLDFTTSFIRTGEPKIKGVDWKRVADGKLKVLNITSPTDIKMEILEEAESMQFWSSLKLKENENFNALKEEL